MTLYNILLTIEIIIFLVYAVVGWKYNESLHHEYDNLGDGHPNGPAPDNTQKGGI